MSSEWSRAHQGVDAKVRLEKPSVRYADSYRALVEEFLDRNEPLVPFPLSFPHEDFTGLLDRLAAAERGEGIPKGFVPNSTYWLIWEGESVVGVSNLRHRLTDALRREGGNIGYGIRPSARGQGFATEILRQTLSEAKALGLREVLLTCARSNEPSVRTILGNGGVLESEQFLPEREEVVQRYWITI